MNDAHTHNLNSMITNMVLMSSLNLHFNVES